MQFKYHVTGILESNLTYLASLLPQDKFPWVSNCSFDPRHAPTNCPREKKRILAICKCMVSMATNNAILLNGSVPTKTTISQLLLSLDY